MTLDIVALVTLIRSVEDRDAVYAADLAAFETLALPKGHEILKKGPREHALDGQAHYVTNVLRGHDPEFAFTFEQVREQLAAGVR